MRASITVVSVLALLVAGLVWGLPWIARGQAEAWLRDQGAPDPQIGTLDWNPFTGRVHLGDVDAGGGPDARLALTELHLDLDLSALFDRHLYLEVSTVSGLALDVQVDSAGALRVGPIVVPDAETAPAPEAGASEGEPWGLGFADLALAEIDVHVHLEEPDLDVSLRLPSLDLGSVSTRDAHLQTSVDLHARVNDMELRARGQVRPVHHTPSAELDLLIPALDLAQLQAPLAHLLGEALGLEGTLALEQAISFDLVDGRPVLDAAGSLSVEQLAIAIAGTDARLERIGWDGSVDLGAEGEPMLAATGSLDVDALQAVTADVEARLQQLSWNGSVDLGADGAPILDATGVLALDALQARAEGMDATVALLTWDGSAGLDPERQPSLRGDLRVEGSRAALANAEAALLRLGELSLEGVELGGTRRLAVERMALADLLGLAVADRTEPLVVLKSLVAGPTTVAALDGAQPHVMLERLALEGLVLDVERRADGSLVLPVLPAAEVDTAAEEIAVAVASELLADAPIEGEAMDADAAALPVRLQLGALTIGGDSRIRMLDAAVDPPFAATLAPLELTLGALDTATPDAPVDLRLAMQQADHTQITLTGTVTPLAGTPSADLVLDIDGFDLPQISAYVPGYALETGRLALDSDLRLRGDQLELENDLLLERLTLTAKAGEGIPGFARGLALPLETALDLMRDREDRIRLSIPVRGALTDPEIGTGDILRRATQGALQQAAFSYVKTALQPLGTILFVANVAGEAAKPRFAPVEFPVNVTDLLPQQRAYLDKLGVLMTDRPSLVLTVCGVATSAEQPPAPEPVATAEAEPGAPATSDAGAPPVVPAPGPSEDEIQRWQLDLAEARARAVRRYLVQQAKVAQERLFACQARIDEEAEAKPRVGLRL